MQFHGTVAIVTGGDGDLGQRICHALAKAEGGVLRSLLIGQVKLNMR